MVGIDFIDFRAGVLCGTALWRVSEAFLMVESNSLLIMPLYAIRYPSHCSHHVQEPLLLFVSTSCHLLYWFPSYAVSMAGYLDSTGLSSEVKKTMMKKKKSSRLFADCSLRWLQPPRVHHVEVVWRRTPFDSIRWEQKPYGVKNTPVNQ